jgi:hypothetical protein
VNWTNGCGYLGLIILFHLFWGTCFIPSLAHRGSRNMAIIVALYAHIAFVKVFLARSTNIFTYPYP